jgi:pyruvate formate lyase activating enzyme
MKEALFYIKEKNNMVKCLLCPKNCEISEGSVGFCKVRENKKGTLFAKTYNQISSIALDPIEKKPLSRYKPGTNILSVGTMGCNFKCDFCQNYHISQESPKLEEMTVNRLLELSNKQTDSIGIAFTYNEPTIWYEYVLETAENNDKDTVLVTNGYINIEPLEKLLPYIDAMNIDLKSMNPDFYRKICRGDLENVKETIKTAFSKTHIELTFLAIPELNDTEKEMKSMAKWISNIDPNIPLHIIPFRPMYKWSNMPFQSYDKIDKLKALANRKLNYVY